MKFQGGQENLAWRFWMLMSHKKLADTSVAMVQTGVFANLSNKIAIIMGKFENIDEAKNQWVFCQH